MIFVLAATLIALAKSDRKSNLFDFNQESYGRLGFYLRTSICMALHIHERTSRGLSRYPCFLVIEFGQVSQRWKKEGIINEISPNHIIMTTVYST